MSGKLPDRMESWSDKELISYFLNLNPLRIDQRAGINFCNFHHVPLESQSFNQGAQTFACVADREPYSDAWIKHVKETTIVVAPTARAVELMATRLRDALDRLDRHEDDRLDW